MSGDNAQTTIKEYPKTRKASLRPYMKQIKLITKGLTFIKKSVIIKKKEAI